MSFALVGAAVAPDVDVVFFHGGNQHGAGYGAAERGGVEIGHAAGGHVKRAALDGSDALVSKLGAAVDQAGVFPHRIPSLFWEWHCSRLRRADRGWQCRHKAARL